VALVVAAYRIVLEAVANAAQHANARACTVMREFGSSWGHGRPGAH